MNAKAQPSIIPRSLDAQVADLLRNEILSGALSPGSRLLEVDLSDRLNLSRGTIRSALQQLTYEGLVVQFPYRGCIVAGLTAQDAWELYTLRNALESLAARLAAETMTLEKAAVLEAALQELIQTTKTADWQAIADADFALHTTIFQLSGHRRLQQQYQIVGHQIRLYIASCNALQADLPEIVAQHIDLVKAICSGDANLAEQIAREHNTEGQALIDQLQAVEDNPAQDPPRI